MDAMYARTCKRCGGRHPVNAVDDQPTPEMIKEAERIAKGIYDGSITTGHIDPALTSLVAEDLRNALIEGFGRDMPSVDYRTPDYAKLGNLEKNVYQFSGAKDYQELKSMTLALKDGDRIRTFAEFKAEALKINAAYNGSWLRTEYNTAVGSAQMAAKWDRFYSDRDIIPLLEYRTVGDDRVRPAHQLLDGVKKNISDPFWDEYYPPNGWNCRCDVIQSVNGLETPDKDIVKPDDVPKMFQVNMGKDGLAFPPKSPYYIGLPDAIRRQGERILAKRILNWGKKYLAEEKVTASTIGEVNFTRNGLKELINQPHEFYTEKNQVVYALKNVMRHAEFVKTEPDTTGRNKQYHYFKVLINGKDSFIVVKETWSGLKTVYSIVDKLK